MLDNDKNLTGLDLSSMVNGIGRKSTDEELINYLTKDAMEEPISLETAFSKYSNQ